jgi:DNA-binding transcriptional ArsR family regulator
MGETEDVVRRCVAIVRAHEPKVAGGAIGMLADVGDAGLDALFGVFDDPRKEVHDIAARALAPRSDHPRVTAFVRSAADSADPRRREAALRIVGRSAVSKPAQTAPELLVAAWRQDIANPQDANRRKLVAMGSSATASVLPLLGDEDRETRVAVVAVLGELGDRSAIPALAAALKDEAATVRAQAAAILGNLSATEASAALRGAVRDAESGVAEAAATALGVLGDPAAVDALIVALGSVEWRLRRAAAEGLGGYREARVAAALARALKEDPHWGVRRAAAEALVRAEGPAAVPALVAALEDPHWFVRSAVQRGLVALTRQDLPAEGQVWRTWWEQKTRDGDQCLSQP